MPSFFMRQCLLSVTEQVEQVHEHNDKVHVQACGAKDGDTAAHDLVTAIGSKVFFDLVGFPCGHPCKEGNGEGGDQEAHACKRAAKEAHDDLDNNETHEAPGTHHEKITPAREAFFTDIAVEAGSAEHHRGDGKGRGDAGPCINKSNGGEGKACKGAEAGKDSKALLGLKAKDNFVHEEAERHPGNTPDEPALEGNVEQDRVVHGKIGDNA